MSTVNAGWRGPNIPKDGLVLFVDANSGTSYSLYNSGNTWRDISGNAYNNTLTNGPIYSIDNGGGITFDGTNDHALGNNSLASRLNDAITLIIWARIPNFNSRVPLFTKYQNAAPAGFLLEVGTLSSLWTRTMRFFAAGNNFSSFSVDYRGQIQLNDNQVYMFTAQFQTATLVRMYYNLNEMTATHAGGSWPIVTSEWTQGTNVYYLGAYAPSVNVYGNSMIYNTILYNRILTTEEIAQIYNSSKSRFGL